MASILDTQSQFYPLLIRFLADESLAPTLAVDEAEAAYEYYMSVHGHKRVKKDSNLVEISRQAKSLLPAVTAFVKESRGAPLSRWILELPDDLVQTMVQVVLSEAVLDDELISHRRLRLLIVHWAAHELRFWTNKIRMEGEKIG
jgi:hypothetical protein